LSFIGVPLIHFLDEIVQVLSLRRQVVLEQLLKIEFISLLRNQLNLVLLDHSLLYLGIHLLCLLTVHAVHSYGVVWGHTHLRCHLKRLERVLAGEHETHFPVWIGLLPDEDLFSMRHRLLNFFRQPRRLVDAGRPLLHNAWRNVHIDTVVFRFFVHLLDLPTVLFR